MQERRPDQVIPTNTRPVLPQHFATLRILISSAQQLLTFGDLFPGVSDGEAPALRHVRLEGFLQEGFCPLRVALPPDKKQAAH